MQQSPRFVSSGIESLTAQTFRHDLAESIGPDLTLAELINEDLPKELALGYGSAPGDAELRTGLAQRLGAEPDEVLVTAGGMHALFLTALVTCEAGDQVVIETPGFPNTRACLDALRLDVNDWRLHFDSGYHHDLDTLTASLDEQLRLLVLTSPQNPSGVAMSPATLRALLASIEQRAPNAYVLIDETYREATYGTASIAPSAFGISERVIVSGSLSKCHGAPGLRVGWVASRDEALLQQLTLAKFNTVISLSRVDEWLANRVLARAPQILASRQRRLSEGLARVENWVNVHREQVAWVRPDAGALCCVRLRPEHFDHHAVSDFHAAAAERDVRVAPGQWFGDEPHVFRLGFGLLAMPELDDALVALGNALDCTSPVV